MSGPTRRNREITMKEDMASAIVNCIEEGQLEKLKSLLPIERVNAVLKNSWTPLLYACMACQYDIVCYLLDSGAIADQHCGLFTPLMAVCSSKYFDEDKLVDCAKVLVSHHANVDDMDCYKTTALMIACRSGRKELVSFLLNSKCDVNKMDNDGMTALHLAVTFNHREIVRLLLDNGAVKNMKNRRGCTPLNAAVTKGLQDIIELLQDPDDSQALALPESYVRKKTSFEEMLAQLPSYNKSCGKNGFYKDVEMLLGGMGLDRLAKMLSKNDVSLSKFLNFTNKELKDLGVLFSSNRKKILYDNLRFIQHPWSSVSLPEVNCGTLNMVDIARSMANTAKHLHVLWASSLYCTNRITFDPEEKHRNEDIYQVTLRGVIQLELLIKELRKIHCHASIMEKEDKVYPVDLILPLQNSKWATVCKVAVVTTIVGLLAWKKNGLSILPRNFTEWFYSFNVLKR